MDHSFSKYAKFSENTNTSYPLIRTETYLTTPFKMLNATLNRLMRQKLKLWNITFPP